MKKDAPIKKTLKVPLLDEEVAVPVTFQVIEVVERVWDCNADLIVAQVLTNPRRVQRRKVAETIVEWAFEHTEIPRSKIREYVITAPASLINVYAGLIQGAVLYALHYIDDEQLAALAKGEDLPEGKEEPQESAPSGLPTTAT